MKKALIGRKIGMTQIFDAEGKVIPVTAIEVGPCTVVQIKTKEQDGYEAVQLGFADVKESKLNKPELGRFAKAKNFFWRLQLMEIKFSTEEIVRIFEEVFNTKAKYIWFEEDAFVEISDKQDYKIEYWLKLNQIMFLFDDCSSGDFYINGGSLVVYQGKVRSSSNFDSSFETLEFENRIIELIRQKTAKPRRKFLAR